MPFTTFKSKARVIDLLGRQQIADIPTALGELFKNALDAGAENVYVNWEREKALLSICDDGVGMRLADVKDKWLVLATESKAAPQKEDKEEWLKYATKQQKEWCMGESHGEKGIGRLSIGKLGRYVILWTVWGGGEERRGVLCFVHWNLFQHPTKSFEELPIPYQEFDHSPSLKELDILFKELRESHNIQEILNDSNFEEGRAIRKDLEEIDKKVLKDMHLSLEETGTKFIIGGLAEDVPSLFHLSKELEEELSPALPEEIKMYSAFSVFWDPFHVNKRRNFQIHPLISGKQVKHNTLKFWEPKDFERCDHHITIEISEDGFAKGILQNFKQEGTEIIEYQYQLPKLPKGAKSPGNFLVEIGYIEGTSRPGSALTEEERKEMNTRLEYGGGFFVYKDSVRIQPYGYGGSDFVEFEKRRLKNAGKYYFSMARMFGGIFLNSANNASLKEKAGREGFIVNGAYKGLRNYLCDLFIDLAYNYYGSKSNRASQIIAKTNKKATERHQKKIQSYIDSIEYAKKELVAIKEKCPHLIEKIERLLAAEQNSVPGSMIHDCERSIAELSRYIAAIYDLPGSKPFGVVLVGELNQKIEDYILERDLLIKELEREEQFFNREVLRAYNRAELQEEKITKIKQQEEDTEKNLRLKIHEEMAPALSRAEKLTKLLITYEENAINELICKRDEKLSGLTPREVINDRSGEKMQIWQGALSAQRHHFEESILPKIRQLVDDITHLDDNSSSAFLLSEQAHELQALTETNAFLVELAQVGLVFETSSHEFFNNISDINKYLSALKGSSTKETALIVSNLEQSIAIIKERISLYDPLIGKRGKEKANLTGLQILNFIRDRLTKQCKGTRITFSESFSKYEWKNIHWPIFLGAIYNIVLNATYWVNFSINNQPEINFSIENESLIISDNGPGINERDIDRIFAPGFSRRRGGRGLGLYIAKSALSTIGYNLYFAPNLPQSKLNGAIFIIKPKHD